MAEALHPNMHGLPDVPLEAAFREPGIGNRIISLHLKIWLASDQQFCMDHADQLHIVAKAGEYTSKAP